MIDRDISTSQQRLRNLLRAPTPQPEAITETILDESGLQARPETPKDKPMTAFSTVADRMKAMRKTIEERRTKNAEKIGTLEKRAHDALDKQDSILAAEEADLKAFENELNQMTNGGED